MVDGELADPCRSPVWQPACRRTTALPIWSRTGRVAYARLARPPPEFLAALVAGGRLHHQLALRSEPGPPLSGTFGDQGPLPHLLTQAVRARPPHPTHCTGAADRGHGRPLSVGWPPAVPPPSSRIAGIRAVGHFCRPHRGVEPPSRSPLADHPARRLPTSCARLPRPDRIGITLRCARAIAANNPSHGAASPPGSSRLHAGARSL